MNTIIAIVDDLFFASKIRGTAEQVGTRVQFVRSIPAAIEKARDDGPALIIADLNAGCCVLELRALEGAMDYWVFRCSDSFPTSKQSCNKRQSRRATIACCHARHSRRTLQLFFREPAQVNELLGVSLCVLCVSVVSLPEKIHHRDTEASPRLTKKCEHKRPN